MRKAYAVELLAHKGRCPMLSKAGLRMVHDVLADRGNLGGASIDLSAYACF